jgi:signal transduction histidine kinase
MRADCPNDVWRAGQAFADLGKALGAVADAEAAAELIVRVADELLGWDACFLILYDPDGAAPPRPLLAMDVVAGRRTSLSDVVPAEPTPNMLRAIAEDGCMVLRDPQAPAGAGPEQPYAFGDVQRSSASSLYVPIRAGSRLIGILSIQSYSPCAYDGAALEALKALANHLGGALERIRVEEALRQSAERGVILYRATEEISASLDPEQIFRAIHRAVAQVMPCDALAMDLYDPVRDEVSAGYLIQRGERVEALPHRADHGLAGRIVHSGLPAHFRTLAEVEAGGIELEQFGDARKDAASILAVPMRSKGQIRGMLSVQSHQPHAYANNDQTLLEMLATHAAIALDNARLFAEVQQLAFNECQAKESAAVANAEVQQLAFNECQAKEAAAVANAELQARNEELDAFAHTVAHDLKNPINLIIGYAGYLQHDVADLPADEVKDSLQMIVQAGDKLDRILEELMLLAGVRKQVVSTEPLRMAGLVGEAVNRLGDLAREKGAEVSVGRPADWPAALGYGPWVEEVWANLISNAIKYGGQSPRVTLGAEALGEGQVRFWVSDNGPGLTSEQRSKLFVPFERLGQAHVAGHGLGLSIVRRIIEKLGGRVGVESHVGHGSTFYFTLPAVDRRA